MPDAPVQIIANASGSAPSAPVQIAADGSGSTPASPVQIAANGSGSTPSAPPVVSSASANLDPGVIIGGTLVPDVTGYLRLVEIASGGRPVYGHPTGVLPADDPATILFYTGTRWELLHYPAGTTGPAARWQANAGTQATPNLATGWAAVAGGVDPTGTPTFTVVAKAAPVVQLVSDTGDGLMPSRVRVTGTLTRDGSTPLVFPVLMRTSDHNGRACWTDNGEDFESELGWSYILYYDADLFSWTLYTPTGGGFGFGGGNDTSPMTVDDWASLGTETGTPVLTAAPAAPVQITANGSGSSPASPVQITGNGSGSTPAAPVQITANSSGSTPTAPPVVVA